MKTWIRPAALQEDFIANSAVSSCIKGTLECSYPGSSKTKGQYIFGDYHGYQSEYWYEDAPKSYKMPHGRCAYPTPVSINTDSWTGYERDANGNILKDHPIQNVDIGSVSTGMHDRVTWQSLDGKTVYHHLGRLNVSLIDDSHPDRS